MLAKGQGVLERLKQGSADAQRTLAAVQDALPDGLGAHVWGAAVSGASLTVLVASAAWATRVRYHAPGLREAVAGRLGLTLERVLVRVRPPGSKPPAGAGSASR